MDADVNAGQPAQTGLRELASTEVAAMARELCGPYEEWRSTVLSFRKALAGLERLCDAASNAVPEDESKRTASAAALVDRIIAAAAAEADAAVQRTRAEADAAAERLRGENAAALERVRVESDAAIERAQTEARADVTHIEELNRLLEADLKAERDRTKGLDEELQSTRHARTQAEAALQDAQSAHQGAVAALQAQLQASRAELDAERAEVAQQKKNVEAEKIARSKLVDALQIVQRAVSLSEPGAHASEMAAAAAQAAAAPATAKVKTPAADGGAEPSVNRPLKLISSKPALNAEVERELTEYVKQLFEQIQSIYDSDLKSTEDSAVVVDRLTANLRHAHSVFGRRLESSNAGESKVFEEQLALLLDTQSQTSFGRHLAIAAYSYAPARDARAEAS